MSKVILFNPRSANSKHRIPNSILQVGASIEGRYDYVFVDGNLEKDPLQKIKSYLSSGEFKYFGCTVMPGLQPKQAIPFTKKVREEFPQVINIWGGYFPANQYKAVLNSGYVDYVINGPGDEAFPQLIDSLERNSDPSLIKNLIFKRNGEFIKTPKADLLDQDLLPTLPYEKLNKFYPIRNYLGKTFLGTKTAAYHSSVGCPFTCSFCAVVPIYEARWKGKSAPLIYKDVKYLKDEYGANAVEFHDNNFFVSEKRTVEFSKLINDCNFSIEYKKFDFNIPIEEQGFSPNSIDVVWGVNAIHVAYDLRFTLKEIFRLLKDNGSLIVSETVRAIGNKMIQQELILNTLDDYWNVKIDKDIRPIHGFMEWSNWVNALKAAGYSDVKTIPDMKYLESQYDNCYVAVIRGLKNH